DGEANAGRRGRIRHHPVFHIIEGGARLRGLAKALGHEDELVLVQQFFTDGLADAKDQGVLPGMQAAVGKIRDGGQLHGFVELDRGQGHRYSPVLLTRAISLKAASVMAGVGVLGGPESPPPVWTLVCWWALKSTTKAL